MFSPWYVTSQSKLAVTPMSMAPPPRTHKRYEPVCRSSDVSVGWFCAAREKKKRDILYVFVSLLLGFCFCVLVSVVHTFA